MNMYAKNFNCPLKFLNAGLYFLTSFVFIDLYLTITESSDLPTLSVQEIVPQSKSSSTETTVAMKGILYSKFYD